MRATHAKVFQNGGTHAARLPKECRFVAQREVLVRRKERCIKIEPVDEWSEEFRACLGSWSGNIPRLKQRTIGTLRNPFD